MAIPSMSIAWERPLERRLGELISKLPLELDPSVAELSISGICEDSRQVHPGDLFVALPGTRTDGAVFAAQAVECGAVAVVAEQMLELPVPCLVVDSSARALAQLAAAFFNEPTSRLFVAAVTGTNGKTSVCHLARAALGSEATTVLGTVENVERAISHLTTPSSRVIQQEAAKSVETGKQYLLLEASSAGIVQHRLESVDLNVAVLTNLSTDHWAFHGSLAAYRDAKLSLFRSLAPHALAVLNAEEPLSDQVRRETAASTFTYGIDCRADLMARDARLSPQETQCRVEWRGSSASLTLPLAGRTQLSNALAALGVALAAGVPLDTAVARLGTVPAIPGRMQRLQDAQGRVAIVDYAHNPAALRVTLEQLRAEFDKIVLVFGAPGDGDTEKRRQMGRVAAEGADRIVLTSDNPKQENPSDIMREIVSGMPSGACPVWISARHEAIAAAERGLDARTVLLVAGKGHERVQWIGDAPVAHSDLEVLQELGFSEQSG